MNELDVAVENLTIHLVNANRVIVQQGLLLSVLDEKVLLLERKIKILESLVDELEQEVIFGGDCFAADKS